MEPLGTSSKKPELLPEEILVINLLVSLTLWINATITNPNLTSKNVEILFKSNPLAEKLAHLETMLNIVKINIILLPAMDLQVLNKSKKIWLNMDPSLPLSLSTKIS